MTEEVTLLGRIGSASRPAQSSTLWVVLIWFCRTVWVMLAFGTMSMPALACFAKLRADRRMTYRHSLTGQQLVFEQTLAYMCYRHAKDVHTLLSLAMRPADFHIAFLNGN